ncbi:MAG: DeoR/GlpR family DNA-binding transcription regulator [Acidobacteriota bacterium]
MKLKRMEENKNLDAAPEEQAAQQNKRQKRFRIILEYLQLHGEVFIDVLKDKLGTSIVTIRRDLDFLEQQGLLSRTHGGAVSIEPLFYEPFKKDRSFVAQVERQAEAKRRIGRAAATLIKPGQTIAVSPGTTTAQIVRALPFDANLTIVTNTANVAMELSKRKDVHVFLTGGHLHGEWFSLVGPTAVKSLESALIHTVFIGVDGIDATFGLSSFSADEAEVIAAMVRNAKDRIVVADHTKLGATINWRICATSEINTLITDTGASDELVEPFTKAGITVLRV